MFFRILKKDLKRKKTMNIILLLFVIMCSMFASASVSNIAAVTGGVDNYFKMSDVPDVRVNMPFNCEMEDELKALDGVSYVGTEHHYCIESSKNFIYKGNKMDNFIDAAYMISDKEMYVRFYDEDNNTVESVEKGCFYSTAAFINDMDVRKGDIFEVCVDDIRLSLKYMGVIKCPTISHDSTASPYLLVDDEDFEYIGKNKSRGIFDDQDVFVNTDDTDQIEKLAEKYENAYIMTRDEIKENFLFDMVAAYIMMMISAVLMVTVFVVLRFTIKFTISEEFREIGVMKAVGVDNFSIRCLYITKYLVISIIGALIGYAASLPLSSLMLDSVSNNMVLESSSNMIIGLLSSAAVVVLILFFCYTCTRRVNKLSPIDAVRNGETGERFKKKSLMHIGRSKLPSNVFMSVNDVVSAPKQFSIITIIFALCLLMMTLMSNLALTLKSEKIAYLFGLSESDAHIFDITYFADAFADFDSYKDILDKTDKMLEENGIPGECGMTLGFRYEVNHGDKTANEFCYVSKGLKNDLVKADEGSMPQKKDEIAMTGYALDDLGAEIGDRVSITLGDKTDEYIITGKYSSFLGGGHGILMHPDVDLVENNNFQSMGVSIKFDGDPDDETKNEYIEKIKKAVDSEKVCTTSELIKTATQMSDTLNLVKQMMMIITVIVTLMIVILMERSFISKEKGEIALMKAVGIPDMSIIAQHTMRFVISALLATIISTAVLMPASNAIMNFVSGMIGDVSGVECDYDPLEIFLICPAILIVVTVIGAFLTALYTKTIKASDTASIE
ncbi:MAG: FtsX-like permease family protein [Ruminococcus sp.]|nr:FtsX-like permease family protein [Ruminococcus sp.]